MPYQTATRIFHDHLGQPHEKPDGLPIIWRPSAYALIARGDRILMVEPRCTPGKWGLPGGGVEPHEALFEGLRRECREELGFEIQLEGAGPVHFDEHDFFFQWTGEYMHSLIHVFRCRIPLDRLMQSEFVPPDPEEITRVAWMIPRELNEGNCHHAIWSFFSR